MKRTTRNKRSIRWQRPQTIESFQDRIDRDRYGNRPRRRSDVIPSHGWDLEDYQTLSDQDDFLSRNDRSAVLADMDDDMQDEIQDDYGFETENQPLRRGGRGRRAS